jgi:hypothetical protein
MDEDAERGLIFVMGLLLGLAAMWVLFTTRGRRTAQEVFEAAADLADSFGHEAGEVLPSRSVRR